MHAINARVIDIHRYVGAGQVEIIWSVGERVGRNAHNDARQIIHKTARHIDLDLLGQRQLRDGHKAPGRNAHNQGGTKWAAIFANQGRSQLGQGRQGGVALAGEGRDTQGIGLRLLLDGGRQERAVQLVIWLVRQHGQHVRVGGQVCGLCG